MESWGVIGVSRRVSQSTDCLLISDQVRLVKSLFLDRMTVHYDYGIEMQAGRETSITPNECNGKSLSNSYPSTLPGCGLIYGLRVFDVTYTPTSDFVLSASDDGNVRIWKSYASTKLGPVSTKERQAIEYRQRLVERWSSVKDVRAVKDRRHVPASVHNTVQLKRDMIESRKVKEDRRRKHTRAGKEKPKAERKSECIDK